MREKSKFGNGKKSSLTIIIIETAYLSEERKKIRQFLSQ